MPLPTSAPQTAETGYLLVVATANAVSSSLNGIKGMIDSGMPLQIDNLIGLYQSLNSAQAQGLNIQSIPGLNAYAKQATGNPDFEIEAEFMRSIIACKAVTDWLLANMPGDGNGGFLGWQHRPNGSITKVVIDVEALAPLSGLVAAAAANFD